MTEPTPETENAWTFTPTEEGTGLKQFILEAVGAASTCWENFFVEGVEVNTGVFLEQKALAIADAIYERANGPEGARLGMATTDGLLRELVARMGDQNAEVAEHAQTMLNILPYEALIYRTVDA